MTIMEGRACNKRRLADEPRKTANSHSHHRRQSVQFRHTDALGIRVATPRPSPANTFLCRIPPISPLIIEGRTCNRLPRDPFPCHTCDNCRFGRRSVQITGGGTCRPWKVERADRFRAPSALTVSTQIMEGGACNGPDPRGDHGRWRVQRPRFRPSSFSDTEGGACTPPAIGGTACNTIPANPQNSADDSEPGTPISFPSIYSSFFVANFEVIGLASLSKKEWPHTRPCLGFPSPSVRALPSLRRT